MHAISGQSRRTCTPSSSRKTSTPVEMSSLPTLSPTKSLSPTAPSQMFGGVPYSTPVITLTTNSDSSPPEKLILKRSLGLSHGIAVIIGLAVGGGIFITPQTVLLHSNSVGLTLCMWALGGLLSLLGALSYAEIGVRYPVAGEKYAYLNIFYGPFFAFAFMWQYLLLMRPGGNAVKALMCARYLLKPMFPDCHIPSLATRLVATLFVVVITALNCLSVKGSLRGQGIMTCITMASLTLISVLGITRMSQGGDASVFLDEPFKGSESNPTKLVYAFHSTIFSYFGWSALNFLIEELKNPKRNLPLSIFISLALTTVLYVLVNLSYVAVLGKQGVLESEAVAISVTIKVFGSAGWFMSLMIAVTACSSFNSGLLVGSRLAHVGARNGHLPKIFSFININHLTPIVSVILQSCMSLVYLWLVDVFGIINNLVFCTLFGDFLVMLAYIKIRFQDIARESKVDGNDGPIMIKGFVSDFGLKNQNESDSYIKMPLFIHVSYLLMVSLLVVISLYSNPVSFGAGFAIVMTVSAIYYILVIVLEPKTIWLDRKISLVGKLLVTVTPKKMISFINMNHGKKRGVSEKKLPKRTEIPIN